MRITFLKDFYIADPGNVTSILKTSTIGTHRLRLNFQHYRGKISAFVYFYILLLLLLTDN